jgi:hypothetical protein
VDAALAVTGLSKRYGATDALRGVDLAVAPGELVVPPALRRRAGAESARNDAAD